MCGSSIGGPIIGLDLLYCGPTWTNIKTEQTVNQYTLKYCTYLRFSPTLSIHGDAN